ncbi:TPA: glycosyltransferase family 4 protein, partial [Streptococcus pneumoniae]
LDGVYGSDKKKLLQKMHYFVLPSYYKDETLPISMLEAMANGLYIIVSDVGVVSEVINKETASLIEMINEETADSIIEIIDQTSNKLNELDFNVSKYKQELLNENIQASIYQQLERIAN